jgi:hypothetical protein
MPGTEWAGDETERLATTEPSHFHEPDDSVQVSAM